MRGDRGEIGVAQIPKLNAARLALADARTGDFVSDAEGDTLPDQPLGNIRGKREALGGKAFEALGVEGHGRDHSREGGQEDVEGVDRVEDRLLVLLQVPVVGQRQRLQGRQQAGEVADEAARLAPGQLGDIGILLLRHDARPGGVGIIESNETELLGRPEHDLLGDPGDVNSGHRADKGELRGEVATGRAVDGVLDGSGEAEVRGDLLGVQAEG